MRLQCPSSLGSMIFRELVYNKKVFKSKRETSRAHAILGPPDFHCREVIPSSAWRSWCSISFSCLASLYSPSVSYVFANIHAWDTWEYLATMVWRDPCVTVCPLGSWCWDVPEHLPGLLSSSVSWVPSYSSVPLGVRGGGSEFYVLSMGTFPSLLGDISPPSFSYLRLLHSRDKG